MKQECVELHLHTNMSAMDGVSSAETLIRRAAALGYKAIAITDHGVVQAFPEAMKTAEKLEKDGKNIKILYGVEAYCTDDSSDAEIETQPVYRILLLAQNKKGLKNLYRLISLSYLQYCYRDKPHIPKSELIKHREGISVGCVCAKGELFSAISANKPWKQLCETAAFYDFLEIQPIANIQWLLQKGFVQNEEQLREWNRTVVRLGDELDIPVCATGDVHYCDPKDEIYRKILLTGQKHPDAEYQPPLYLRSADEMIAEFAYLGEEKAYEVVVENPNKIADSIEVIRPIPNGFYPPHIDGAEEMLQESVWRKAKEMYGDLLPGIVKERLEWEVSAINNTESATQFLLAQKLVQDSVEHGYLVGYRGSVGSSLVAYLAGITEVNPLVPHYVCPKCHYSEFFTDGSICYGFDLPEKTCPICGEALRRDGHDIPVETFLGFYGSKIPDIDLNFSGEYQPAIFECLQSLFGKERVLKAGTIGRTAEISAKRLVKHYIEEQKLTLNETETNILAQGCIGAKRTTGQHPGAVMIIPEGHDVYDFTPLQYSANDPKSDVITTHFDFHALQDAILKMDILGHDIPTLYKYLEEYTGIPVTDVPMCDTAVYSLFTSPEALGVTPKEIDCETGTLSLPELGTEFVHQMLIETKPKNFSDLMQISGLLHGTNVWINNAQELIRDGVCTLSDVIAIRDNIMTYLIQKGIEPKIAFEIMEIVKKGQASIRLTEAHLNAMRGCDVPEWYIDSCMKIQYIFPKAHAVLYMIAAVRLGWYKVYYPTEYYAAYFTVHSYDFDRETVVNGKQAVRTALDETRAKGKDVSWKESAIYQMNQIVYEAMARGIEFLPIDLHRSHATQFLAENGKIRLPLSLSGE